MIPTNYNEAVEYLFTLRTNGTKLGLDSIRYLLDELGSPDNKCDYIHVAGTNGKGSTSAMISSIFQSAGLKVGLFTSPHLVDFTERIQVNSINISENKILSHLSKIDSVIQNMNEPDTPRKPTFFEVVTAIAVLHFAEEKCDVVILETGMGGRLDATNAINSCASVITKIDLDHTKWLGNNISNITMEKAGIIKLNNPVFTSNRDSHILDIIKKHSIDKKCRLTCVIPENFIVDKKCVDFISFLSEHYKSGHYTLNIDSLAVENTFINLPGRHQAENAALASIVAIWYLKKININNPQAYIKSGLENIVWPARCQVVSNNPYILLDCAHNPNGIKQLVRTLKEIDDNKWIFVLGVLNDKNVPETIKLISEISEEIWYVKPNSQRGLEFDEFKNLLQKAGKSTIKIKKFERVKEIVMKFRDKDVWCDRKYVVTGSCYLIGDFMSGWKESIRDNRTDDPL